jgi:uncharacterized protein (TIGR02145 family)
MKLVKHPYLSFGAWSGILAGCLFLSAACSEEEASYNYTTYSSYMKGALNTGVHDYYVKGATLYLTAGGVTAPSPEQITFQWTVTDTAQHSAWGQVVKYRCPEATDGAFTIALAASAYDTYGLSASHTVTVIESTFAQSVKNIAPGVTFTDDRDGQTYQYTTVGSLDWMTQNLNWNGAGSGSIVGKDYKDESEYGILFGRYYSWNEATDAARPVCPTGWRVPANADWEDLGTALNGGTTVTFASHWQNAGSQAAVNATVNDKPLWPYDPNNTKQNTVQWNALPAGKVLSSGEYAESNDKGRYGYWWSATDRDASNGFYRYIVYNNALCYFHYGNRDGLYLSIRCVR